MIVGEVTIRLAEAADLPAIGELVQRAYRGESARAGWTHEADLLDGQRIDLAQLAEMLGNPGQAILAAESRRKIIGCVHIADGDGGVASLGMLAVDPLLQANGLGRRLINAAEVEAARRFGSDRIEMTVIKARPDLIAYYGRRGYLPTGEERPFPLDDPRFGLPRSRDLAFVVLNKSIEAAST